MESNVHYQFYDEEREKKLRGIEGLDELAAAIADDNLTFEKIMKLEEKYPRAAAYRKAQGYSWAAHPKRSALGEKAMSRILDGEDHTAVIQEMEDAWAIWQLAQEG